MNPHPLEIYPCPFCGQRIAAQKDPDGQGGRMVHADTACDGFARAMAGFGLTPEKPPAGHQFVAIAGDPEGLRRTLPRSLIRK